MNRRTRAIKAALCDPELFSRHIIGRPLRPYQIEPARAILRSIDEKAGDAITVMMSRQAGKNELSAQLEAFLLNRYQRRGGFIVKCAPTFKPQVINSKLRLEQALTNPLNAGRWRSQFAYMVALGKARVVFFSAEPTAQVVGATASIAMEFDEAQDIALDKHDKDFMPMAATTNATRVYYGTAWDERTLLQRQIERDLELERKDGRRRHFAYPWWVVAEHNPLYGRFVEAERARLGESHPMFRTQYLLETIAGDGGFLTGQHRAQVIGDHPRRHAPVDGRTYVAGVDVAGEDEEAQDEALRAAKPKKDSTVVTIAEVEPVTLPGGIEARACRVVDHYWWTGRGHVQQYRQLLDLLRNVWRCQRIVVDATGIGAGIASFLSAALGESVVEAFTFTAASKSELGYQFLAAINAGGFKMYRETAGAEPGWSTVPLHDYPAYSPEAVEFWRQCKLARYEVKANNRLNFFVDVAEGHDDFLMSAALCARAAAGLLVTPAAAIIQPPSDYEDGRF